MAAGVWTYALYTEARGIEMHAAARRASLFWAGLGAGRVLFGFALSALPGRALLRLSLGGIVVASVAIAIDRAVALGQSLLPAAIGFLAGGLGLEVVGPVLVAAAVALVVIHGRLERRTAEGTFPRPAGVLE